jgi:Xaa-Pro dipeptidase
MLQLGCSEREYRNRVSAVQAVMKEKGLDAFIFWNGTSAFYLSGFVFISTERPMCLILGIDGKRTMFVPRLEVEHAQKSPQVDAVVNYMEYPSETHPMNVLAEKLTEMGYSKTRLGADAEGYGSPQGYKGPRLSEVLPEANITVMRDLVERLRAVKSEEEIALIRESARWGNLAHALLQEYSLPGKTENEISMRASLEATIMMIKTLGKSYNPASAGRAGASAGFRGQIGANAAFPHAITINAVLRKGDVLVTGAGAAVAGYGSELERTMFVQEVSLEQRKFFDHMLALQDIAFEAIRPGRKCSDVDKAVMAYFEKHDLWEYWRHHTGHALGLLGHEAPFLDVGDHTVIEPGMVFSVEPGLYVPGLGGFRHSDTIVVTETGIEFLTYYPRQLKDLITG